MLSFTDRNYVGFRKITVTDRWVRGELPSVKVEAKDTYGMCVHLSADAFVEFEEAVSQPLCVLTACRKLKTQRSGPRALRALAGD